MSKGFDWRKLAPRKQFPTLVVGGAFVVFAGLMLPALFTAGAAPDPNSATVGPIPPVIYEGPSLGTILTRLACGIAVVSGLIVATVTILKNRQLAPKKVSPTEKREIEVLGTLAVGRGLVYHVKIGNQHMLAGTDAFGFKSLIQLPAPRNEFDSLDSEDVPLVLSERFRVNLPPGN